MDAAVLPAQFSCFLKTLGPFEAQPYLAVAVSGGADSMALALLSQQWAHAHNGQIIALIIDHGLRSESAMEAAQTRAWLVARGINAQILKVQVDRQGALQNAARNARYEALFAYCQAHGILHLLTAHHAGDQLETAMMHEARGVSEHGSSAMAAVRLCASVRLLRPLLAVPKTVLQDYLRAQGQDWVEDPSNQNRAFTRVQCRMQLAGQHLDEQMQRHARVQAAGHARDQAAKQLVQDAAGCVALYPEAYAELALAPFMQLPRPRATLVLANLLRTLSGGASRPRKSKTLRLYDSLCGLEKQGAAPHWHATLNHIKLCYDAGKGQVLLFPELAHLPALALQAIRGEGHYAGRFQLHWQLPEQTNAAPFPDYRIAPLGAAGLRQIAEHLPAHAAKRRQYMPKPVQNTLPALWWLDSVLIVPHIGYRCAGLNPNLDVSLAFAPAKPLGNGAFYCLNAEPFEL